MSRSTFFRRIPLAARLGCAATVLMWFVACATPSEPASTRPKAVQESLASQLCAAPDAYCQAAP